jgi:hypothetical protein
MRSTTHSTIGIPLKAQQALTRALCIGLCCAGLWALATPQVHAATEPKKKVLRRVEYIDPRQRLPGGETPYDRERRLKRECKGRPNAGACSGHAS